jgi:hypothetical protein
MPMPYRIAVGTIVLLAGLVVPLPALERATAVTRLRSDLTFLASDECEGRGPGTAGIDRAADYIAAAFKQAGLKGAMPDGSYFQPFTIKGDPELGRDNAVALAGPNGPTSLRLGLDFQPLGLSGGGAGEGPVVFVGFGATVPKAHYDDFHGVDVAGKVVLLIRKVPRYGAQDHPFGDDQTVQEAAALATKLGNAARHKAAAVLMCNDADEPDDPLLEFGYSAFGQAVDIPAVHVKREFADRLLRAGMGRPLAEVEKAIEDGLKPLSAPLKDVTAKVRVTVERKPVGVKNVVGVLDGAGPLAKQTVVIGAHYDHLGYGGRSSTAPGQRAIHHGADDNASGTAALIELARRWAADAPANRRRVVFIAFSAEEVGLLGSAHYVNKEPLFPLADTVAMVNLDMVGRLSNDAQSDKPKLEVGGTGTAKEFDEVIDGLGRRHGFAVKKNSAGVGPSDHTSFYVKGVPVFFFFTGLHREYHKPTDTADRINFDGLGKVTDLVEDLARMLAMDGDRPEYVQGMTGSMPTGRLSVPRLGFMPGDYGDDAGGVLIAAVTKGGPADQAGIKDGDLIVEVAGKPVKNMGGYMTVMGGQRRGRPVEIVVMRKGERVKVTVTPQ